MVQRSVWFLPLEFGVDDWQQEDMPLLSPIDSGRHVQNCRYAATAATEPQTMQGVRWQFQAAVSRRRHSTLNPAPAVKLPAPLDQLQTAAAIKRCIHQKQAYLIKQQLPRHHQVQDKQWHHRVQAEQHVLTLPATVD